MKKDVLAVCILLAVGAVALLPVLGLPPSLPPFDQDNLDSLGIATQNHPRFFTPGPSNFVYRPITYFSMWGEVSLFGLHPSVLFSTNLLLWLACGLVLYILVRVNTHSWLVALAAGVALLTDHRVDTALTWIIERQSTLACLLGGSALAIAYRLPKSGRTRLLGAVSIALLLTAAMLSKEYGAAFVAATATVALVNRPDQRRALLTASAAALVAYAGMRWLVPEVFGPPPGSGRAPTHGPGARGLGYCEDLGLLWHQREICYGQIDLGRRVVQYGWNVGATLVSTAYPYLFGGQGNLNPLPPASPVASLVYPTMVLALAAWAWIKRPRASLPLLALIVANAGLNYVLFRHRNQLIGAMGLYGSAALGLQPAAVAVSRWLESGRERLGQGADPASNAARRRGSRAAALGVAALVAGVAAWGVGHEARGLRNSIDQQRSELSAAPCTYVSQDIQPRLRRFLDEMPATARCRSGRRIRSTP